MTFKRNYEDAPVLQESVAGMALRLGVLWAQLLALILLSTFPFKFWHFAEVRPAFLLMGVYYWAIFRPQLLSPLSAFCAGLVLDLLYAAPLGLNALTLVAVHGFTRAQRRFLAGQSFVVLWACFFLMAGVVFVFQWGVFSLFGGYVVSLRPALISAALTGFLFPLMAGAFHTFGRIRPGRDRPG